jgi:acyl-CoA synthetase (AMP-forming)/AMP-acid ligase II
MIVSGGFNIYPAEIENVLCGHPAVDMALVVGVPDAKWGEAVRAVVKLKPDQHLSEKQLLDFCKEKKGSVIAPKSIEFVPHIPLASLGKPDKKRVRDRYWSKRDRKI